MTICRLRRLSLRCSRAPLLQAVILVQILSVHLHSNEAAPSPYQGADRLVGHTNSNNNDLLTRLSPSQGNSMPGEDLTMRQSTQRGYIEAGCGGFRDLQKYSQLELVCDRCRDHFRSDELFLQCRQNCFTTDWFPYCAGQQLATPEQLVQYNQLIDYIG